MECSSKIGPGDMLGFSQPDGELDEEKTVCRGTDCANSAGSETITIEAMAPQHGASEQSVYRGKRQFGNMEVAFVRELRQLR